MSAGAKIQPPSRVGLAPATGLDDGIDRRLAPIRINLLPHRELRRDRRKKDFGVTGALVAVAGLVAAFAGGFAINQQIAAQQERNDFVKAANAKLDKEIAEIRTLREEIAALRARQQAVENLQTDRTVPVRMFDELVRLVPEGLQLRTLRQDDARVVLTGHAQTNERVAELLRNLAERSPWLERPELAEIKEITLQPGGNSKEAPRKVYEFSLNALIKRPSAADPKATPARMVGAPAVPPTAAATPGPAGPAR
jgi:type IV pilus assembly protein PilN